jgi:hypothetical protein
MWIESYKAGGKRYYRACGQGMSPIHLGSAESIVRKLKPNVLRSEAKVVVDPTNIPESEVLDTHEVLV